jgi:long-chain acyl-CoA synthetase
VDSPQFFNRLAESLIPRISARFIVLLWGDKSSIDSKPVKDIPIYDYKDITELGQESRNSLLHSRQQGTFLHDIVIWYGQVIKWQCA